MAVGGLTDFSDRAEARLRRLRGAGLPPVLALLGAASVQRRSAMIVELLLVLWLAAIAAGVFWLWAQPSDYGDWRPENAAATPSGPAADASVLFAFNPFALAQGQEGAEVSAATVQAQETTLNLVLYGVQAGADPEAGYAIIGSRGSQQENYSVGMEVMDGVTLEQVYPGRVILSRNGVLESLALEGFEASGPVEPVEAAPRPVVARNGAVEIAVTPQLLEAVSSESLLTDIGIRPRREDGRLSGYVLSPGARPDIFAALGLQNGDVLIRLNGLAIEGAVDLERLAGRIRDAERMVMEVERGGETRTIRIELE